MQMYKRELFRGDGSILHLDWGGGYMVVHICWSKLVELYACQLHVNYTSKLRKIEIIHF